MNINPTLLANIVSTLSLIRIGLEEGHLTVSVPEGAEQSKRNLIDTINALHQGVEQEVLAVLHGLLEEANDVATEVSPDNVIVFPSETIEA